MKKKRGFREKIAYWFDNRMAKGTVSMVKVLAIFSLIVVVVISLIIALCGFAEEEGLFPAFWDSLATLINAWMPASGDGSVGYILLTAVTAVFGLFVTSVLIGILSSAIEERLGKLRRGNSLVLERGHIVVLGFIPGEYELLRQLISAAGSEKRCIVLADELERDTMDDLIRENLTVPGNVRILCRYADIGDPASLECCSLPDSKAVIINAVGDERTVKAILAADRVLRDADNRTVDIIGTVSADEYQLPKGMRDGRRIMTVQTGDLIAKVIARSCTQPGLSYAFDEIFNYQGSELYLSDFSEGNGKTFRELVQNAEGGVPVGLMRNGETSFAVPADAVFFPDDRLIFFGPEQDSLRLRRESVPAARRAHANAAGQPQPAAAGEKLVIIGVNPSIRTVLTELSDRITDICLANVSEEAFDALQPQLAGLSRAAVTRSPADIQRSDELAALVSDTDYVVLLNPVQGTAEESVSDAKIMVLLLRLRQIREAASLRFSITTELSLEKSRDLVLTDDLTDFVVASNMAAMLVAQIAEKPELYSAIRELISRQGADLCLQDAARFLPEAGSYPVSELRVRLLEQGFSFLGYIRRGETSTVVLDPPVTAEAALSMEDKLICIGEAND